MRASDSRTASRSSPQPRQLASTPAYLDETFRGTYRRRVSQSPNDTQRPQISQKHAAKPNQRWPRVTLAAPRVRQFRISSWARSWARALVKALYAIPTWSRTAALIAEHDVLREALGDTPSVYGCYRFATKLRAHHPVVEATLGAIVSALRAELPEYGKDTSMPPTFRHTRTGSDS
jgi:hypothetical protein